LAPAGLAVGLALCATRPAGRDSPRETDVWVPRFRAGKRGIRRRRRYQGAVAAADPALFSVPVDTDRTRAIIAAVRATPEGFVRTYGDVSPGAPRVAGAVLHACHDPNLPWHRIVRADGSLAKGQRQRSLLQAEGVPFRAGRVDMRAARLPEL
jgi:methylated-DNA-protein-cysteine methyltransferase related protein